MPVVIQCPRCGRPAEITMPGTVVRPHEAADGAICHLSGSADDATARVDGPRRYRLEAALVQRRHQRATRPKPKTAMAAAQAPARKAEDMASTIRRLQVLLHLQTPIEAEREERADEQAAELAKEAKARKAAARAEAKSAARAEARARARALEQKRAKSRGPWIRVVNGGSPGSGKRS